MKRLGARVMRASRKTAPIPPPEDESAGAEARRAKLEATTHYLQAVDNGLDVKRQSTRLRLLRERNGFGELFQESLRRRS